MLPDEHSSDCRGIAVESTTGDARDKGSGAAKFEWDEARKYLNKTVDIPFFDIVVRSVRNQLVDCRYIHIQV